MKIFVRCMCTLMVSLAVQSMLATSLSSIKRNITRLYKEYVRQDALYFRTDPEINQKALEGVEDFIGDEGMLSTSASTKRKKDVKRIVQLWRSLIQKMDKGFKQLQVYLPSEFQKAGYVPLEHLDRERLNAKEVGKIRHLFSSVISSREEVNRIAEYSIQAQMNCKTSSCKDKFGELITLASALYGAIEELDQALNKL